jgi:hypothetical protein
MPLLDHFHPPLSTARHWEGFHSKWANSLSDLLNEDLLPSGYFAEPATHGGNQVEIDVAAFETEAVSQAAAAPALVMPSVVPDTFEVRVYNTEAGPTPVASVELVSPRNKDRAEARRAFAAKCAGYLYQGIHLIVVDIVTSRYANLHDEIIRLMEREDAYRMAQGAHLYGMAYRVARRASGDQIEMWPAPLAVGRPLPVMPLALTPEVTLPLDLETAYTRAARLLRIL